MISIGTTELYLDVESLPEKEFAEYSSKLFDEWEQYISQNLSLTDYSLSLNVEEGSIKAKGKIATSLAVLYFGIGQYGSFISGLETISDQVKDVGNFLAKSAVAPLGELENSSTISRRGDSISKLRKLFSKVHSGELSVDDAMAESKLILGEEVENNPGFMEKLFQSLSEILESPEQIPLPLEPMEEKIYHDPERRRPKPSKRSSSSGKRKKKFRIEVWRDSKNGNKNVKVVKIG